MLSSTALRLSALVAAAMSAGYLWRAAVEPEPGGTAAKVAVVQPGQRLQPRDVSFNSLDVLRRAQSDEEPAAGGQADSVAQKQTEPAPRSSAQLVAVTVQASNSSSVSRSTKPVTTKPTNGGRKPPKPAPSPRPNPPPPPPPPPAPQPPPAPPPPPPPPPAPQPPPAPPPPPPPVAVVETRPGRGRGDKNHRHTGPPGRQKPKKGKGDVGSQGQASPPGQQGSNGGGHGNGNGNGHGNGNGNGNGRGRG